MHFTKQQKESFRDHGYLAGPAVLSDDQVHRLRQRMDGIFDGSIEFPDLLRGVASANVKGNPKLSKLANLFRHDDTFAQVIEHSSIAPLAHDLLPGPVRVWEDQAIAKAPTDEFGVVAWHQDYTCWIALDDATVENGCMQVIPGSHKWDLEYGRLDVDDDDPDWLLKHPQIPAGADLEPVHCPVKAGHCHFHHCKTFHGSSGNTTDRPRRSYILHLMPGHTRRIGDNWNPRMASVESVAVGEIVSGPQFPLMPAAGSQ